MDPLGNVLYVPKGSTPQTIKQTVSLANAKKLPLLSGSEKAVHLGGAVGVTIENAKPKIVVNLTESKKQEMSLSNKLLQIAKIVK